jgi:hypothetical protein
LTRQLPRTLLTAGLDCRYEGKKVVTYEDASASKIALTDKVGAYGVLYKSNKDNEVVALTEVETVFIPGKFSFTSAGLIDTYKGLDGVTYNLSSQAKEIVDYFKNGTIDQHEFLNAYSAYQSSNSYTANPYYGYYYTTSGSGITAAWSQFNYFVNGEDRYGFGRDTATATFPGNYIYNSAGVPSKLIVAARVSGKTILDLRSVAVWDAELNGSDTFLYETDQIAGTKFNGHNFPLDYNNEVDEYGYVLAGADKLDDLAVDNVIYVYKNRDKNIKRIEVGTETQSGVVTNWNEKDEQSTVGGKVLGYAPYHGNGFSDVQVVNNEGTALLDLYGRIYDFQLGEASKGNFALIVNHGTDGYTAAASPIVKLFDKEGKENTYNLTSTVRDKQWWLGDKTNEGVPIAGSTIVAPNTVALGPTYINWYTAFGTYTKDRQLPKLIGYKLSGSRLSSVKHGEYVGQTLAGSTENYATVNSLNSIIKVPVSGGNKDYLIDSGAVLFIVNDKGDYSLGNIADIKGVDLKNPFQYILNDRDRVGGLVVHEKDAGAQHLYIMISNITDQSSSASESVAQVHGLSFADGVGAGEKTWLTDVEINAFADTTRNGSPSTLDALRNHFGLPYNVAKPRHYWFEIVKFRIGEDGVLRGDSARLLRYDDTTAQLYGSDEYGAEDVVDGNPDQAVINAGLGHRGVYYVKGGYSTGLAGAFQVDYAYTSTSAIALTHDDFAVFDADALFYSLSGGKWTVQKVNTGAFNGAGTTARYIFLKTDPTDFTFDVIVRVDNLVGWDGVNSIPEPIR